MRHAHNRMDSLAGLRIVVIYALFASLWIYFSDNLLGMMVKDTAFLVRISVMKGLVFIFVTGVLLYELITRYLRKSRLAEEAQEATVQLLSICNKAESLRELMHELTHYFRELTGCEAIGVRLRQGDDFPYYETRGFPEEFVLAESSLCAIDQRGEIIRDSAGHPALDCMCGNIVCGRFDPLKSFFTERGSFWSSCTTELLASTTDADRQAKTRNRCNGEGYESVALVPLRVQGETFGLFQFNDRNHGRFTPEKIALLEDLVSYVAIALAKLKNDDEVRALSRKIELILNSAGEGIYGLDMEGKVTFINSAGAAMLGWEREELIGRSSHETWHHSRPDKTTFPAAECRLHSSLLSGNTSTVDHDTFWRNDGVSFPVEYSNRPIYDEGKLSGAVVTFRDITQRINAEEENKKLEAQYRQAQKMEAIGTLAGGVAHDFNNILTGIMGYQALIDRKMKQDDPLKPFLTEISGLANRAAHLTHSLLAFSRKQVMEPKLASINGIISNLEKMLGRIIGEDIDFSVDLADGDLAANVDRGQIEQTLMNLVTNARDAMPRGGALKVATKRVQIDEGFVRAHGCGEAGGYAVILVSDTGEGMDGTTKENIFEPFFTTKEVGKGTGLGLAMVYGIVKQHDGFINVYSEVGKGTTFKIYLPLAEAVSEIGNEQKVTAVVSGNETILLVEDDQTVRKIAGITLEESGYTVLEAVDGEDGVKVFRDNKESVQLIICDVIMPKMNGKEVRDTIHKIKSDVKVLFMSGYPANVISTRGFLEEGAHLMSKPVSPNELLRKVRETLDE